MPKAGGKWNTFEIAAKGPKVITAVLNGTKTVELQNGMFARGRSRLQTRRAWSSSARLRSSHYRKRSGGRTMHYRILRVTSLAAGLLALPSFALDVAAQLAVSANDFKAVLVDGVNTVPANPAGDTVSIIDLICLAAQASWPRSRRRRAWSVRPPASRSRQTILALVTAATKLDPADPKKTAPDNKVWVIDSRRRRQRRRDHRGWRRGRGRSHQWGWQSRAGREPR